MKNFILGIVLIISVVIACLWINEQIILNEDHKSEIDLNNKTKITVTSHFYKKQDTLRMRVVVHGADVRTFDYVNRVRMFSNGECVIRLNVLDKHKNSRGTAEMSIGEFSALDNGDITGYTQIFMDKETYKDLDDVVIEFREFWRTDYRDLFRGWY